MKKNFLFTLLMAVSVLAFGQKLPFQGKLIELGTPVDGTRTFVFEIAAAGWSESHTDVPVTNGLYFVVLGSINPLPDSLFVGVDEQSMDISVDDGTTVTDLSAVTLFKPLSTPFEGSELVVRNDQDTIVGRFANNTDSQAGELVLNGPNGLPNAIIGNGSTPDEGQFNLFDDQGLSKVSFNVSNGYGRLFVVGPYGPNLATNFFTHPNGHEYNRMNLRAMNRVFFHVAGNSYQDGAGDTIVSGTRDIQSLNRNTNVVNFKNTATPGGTYLYQESKLLSQIRTQDWGGTGYSAFAQFNGPNSTNIEMGGRFWNNADIPYFKMNNSQNQYALELSLTEDSTETPFLNMNSRDGKTLYLSPGGFGINSNQKEVLVEPNLIRLIRTGDNWREFAVIHIDNKDNTGDAGYFGLRGPTNDNINFGGRHWEGNADLPFMHFIGENNYLGIDLGMSKNNEGQQFGWINLMSENGKNLHLSPDGFGVQGVSMSTTVNQNGNFGSLLLDGSSSRNISLMPEWWNNPDMAKMVLSGTSSGSIDMEVADEGNGQFGMIHLYSDYQKSIRMEPTYIALRDDANGYNPLVLMHVNNDSGNGWAGNLNLNGPNSPNVIMGAQGNPDLPKIDMFGSSGQQVLWIGCTPTGEGEAGEVFVKGSNGTSWVTYSGNGIFASSTLTISTGLEIAGDFVANGTVLASSDRRLKTNIQSLGNNTLQKVQILNGVSYNWRQDEFPEKNFSSDRQIGVIAQELEAQFPDLVKTNADGYKSVNYNGFTAVLLEAVKELNAKVEKLETENVQLKAELSALAVNSSEIEGLKVQMQTLLKAIQKAGVLPAGGELTSTSALK